MSRTFGHFKDKDTEAQPGSSNWLKVMWLMKAASRIPAHTPGPSAPPSHPQLLPASSFALNLGGPDPGGGKWYPTVLSRLRCDLFLDSFWGFCPELARLRGQSGVCPLASEKQACVGFFWPFPGKEEGNAISGNAAC